MVFVEENNLMKFNTPLDPAYLGYEPRTWVENHLCFSFFEF